MKLAIKNALLKNRRTAEDVHVICKAAVLLTRHAPAGPQGDEVRQDGLSSGYPSCCVEFFVSTIYAWDEDEMRTVGVLYWDIVWRWDATPGKRAYDHIPCPECLLASRYGRPIPAWLQKNLSRPGQKSARGALRAVSSW